MSTKYEVCEDCGDYSKEVGVMCECQEYAEPVAASKYAFKVTCSECGFGGTVEAVELHSCDIQNFGGRCEDFPCCGHPVDEGCQMRREFTSDYWTELYRQNPHLMED